MQDYKAPLDLNENYSFDVLVKDHGTNFAGKLTLSPNECTLKVMGERQISLEFYNFDKIECFTLQNHFLLSDVQLKNFGFTSLRLNDQKNRGSFFEIEFHVGLVIKSNTKITKETLFNGFCIESDIIKEWTGITNKQAEVLMKVSDKVMFNNDLNLFEIPLDNTGILYLSYSLNIHTNLKTLSSGVKLTPQLGLFFYENKCVKDFFKEIKKLYVFISFFWGSGFQVNQIKVNVLNLKHCNVSAYYPKNFERVCRVYPLVPLGFDLQSRVNDYIGLPFDVFKKYYNLSKDKVEYFNKYIRYREMKSDEEKFLGYFRILEKIVYQSESYVNPTVLEEILEKSENYLKIRLDAKQKNIKSLIKRVLYANNGKFNTSTCISKFYELIPDDLKEIMDYSKSDIEKICKLRNDITHANEYYIKESELYGYTQFIQQLLCFAMFNKLLETPLEILAPLRVNFKKIT